jgi:hypothetical protein
MAKKSDSTEYDFNFYEDDKRIELSEQLKIKKEEASLIFRKILIGLKTETVETKQASRIAIKYISKGVITKQEEIELRQQVYDILKTLGIAVPFALIPGASLLMPFLVKIAKKKGVNLLPSAFNKDEGAPKKD